MQMHLRYWPVHNVVSDVIYVLGHTNANFEYYAHLDAAIGCYFVIEQCLFSKTVYKMLII